MDGPSYRQKSRIYLQFDSILVPVSEAYKLKISENPLELGKTVIIAIGVREDLAIIQALIEYEEANHSMKLGGVNIWVCDNWTPSAIGEYPFIIHLENKSGSFFPVLDVLKVVLDTTPPKFQPIDEEEKEVAPGSTVKISISIRDSYGIKNVLLEFNRVNYSMVNIPSTEIWQYEITAPSDIGVYTYKIYIEDNYSNWNTTSGTIEVSAPPEIEKPPEWGWWLSIILLFGLGIMVGALVVSKWGINYRRKSQATQISEKKVETTKKVEIECPKCKKTGVINVPISIYDPSKGIRTLSVPKDLICGHSFQVFLDHFFEIRGYQPADYEIEPEDFEAS